MIRLAWRLLARELRSGELRLLFLALTVAVAALSAVGFFTERVRLALVQESHQLMGADLLLVSDHPLTGGRLDAARAGAVQFAETRTFPSMLLANGQAQLAEIKAVSAAYPLRGRLSIRRQIQDAAVQARGGPAAGTVWLDERLQAALQVVPGDTIMLGQSRLQVAAILTHEPDRGINFFSVAPRLLMHLDDLPATALVQAGSRLNYRYLFAGNEQAVAALRQTLEPQLERGERLEDASNARPEMRNLLERSERFLALASLLTVILAAVAVALAARRYVQRHLDACAVMRCLGLTRAGLLRLHGILFFALALLSLVTGGMLGFLAHYLLVDWLGGLLAIELPMPGGRAWQMPAAVAFVLLFGFALPPLLQLAKVPTLRVLRRELGAPPVSSLVSYLLGWCALAGLMWQLAGDAKLGGLVIAGFTLALALFFLLAWLIVQLLARLRLFDQFALRQGQANLRRHAFSASVQIVALALGLMALLLLTVTRGELLDGWQRNLPADAPNRFVINIQPDQQAAVSDFLQAAGVRAELFPMVRGRLSHIGEQAVSAARYPDDERAQRLVEREFNLSWRDDLPEGNSLAAGQWFAQPAAGQGEASVEQGLAKTLNIQLGDSLRFLVAGETVQVRVTSLRQLAWDSMRVNFFVITPPGVLEDAPASDITSFHLPPEKLTLSHELTRAFPNLTVIDISAILQQLKSVTEQVSLAVEFIFLFTLTAGLLVLHACLLSAVDERRQELAVMRALGAQKGPLRQSLLFEMGIMGAIAGLIAALGAGMLGQEVATRVFRIDSLFNIRHIPLGIFIGSLLALATSWFSIQRLLRTPAIEALRSGG